ncbi:OPT oligopeptide transporter protein-domain-containing protein [Thamnocephalis sphaerospora]|uniref:OPT oligopeptide transporter protein-domain-containing protein n=1 Tax=Thamnocephalis sphaerospora TaxID=78915 RepID=A0A4V1IWR3_9FUNG|nr:OPT oligopeptide transporter protein-domain-containing protein [Thamnocephalis sphaerospora]|eukprot:RKP08459.1 OPT oligopeptide transporter protein-domain-containing protein [Thamnocephalis sphaerospora]
MRDITLPQRDTSVEEYDLLDEKIVSGKDTGGYQSSSDGDDYTVFKNENGEEDSPYEVVRMTVSNKDDTTLPTLTVRFWIMAVPITIALAFVKQLFWFRTVPVGISGVIIQLITLPIGKFLARVLPDKDVGIGRFRFSLNPGPFSVKEHLLVNVCTSASGVAYAIDIIVIKRVFYQQDTPLLGSILLTLTTQCIGYGLAGVCYKYLVRPAAMIWPMCLIDVAVYRTFHSQEDQSGGRMTRWRFFTMVTAISGIYYFIPGFLFRMVSTVSVLCLTMPNSKVASQLGSFTKGLGLLSFSLDWNTLTSVLGSPMGTPFWAIANIFAGFVLFVWVITPYGYFNNIWDAQNYSIFGSALYSQNGSSYPVLALLDKKTLALDELQYAKYGPPRMSFMFAIGYGIGFAALSSLLVHIALHYGPDIMRRFRESRASGDDVHARLMDHYPTVPQWWYLTILGLSTALSIFTCEYYGTDLPWWGLLLAVAMAALFTLPIGILTAVASIGPGLNIITEFVIGFIMPGKPIANVTFKTYGYIGMTHAVSLLQDLKLGHYMKIPPRHMFIVQLVGTVISAIVNVLVASMMFQIMPDVCHDDNEEWYCRGAHVFFSASVIWGVVGPNRMFGSEGYYSALMWFFLIGAVLPIPFWLLARRYPKSIAKYINIPVVLASVGGIPPDYTGTFPSWFAVGVLFQYYLLRYRPAWSARYSYILSAGLDAGIAITSIVIFLAFTNTGVKLRWWGNTPDCPLLENKL